MGSPGGGGRGQESSWWAPSGKLHPRAQPKIPSEAQPGPGQPDVPTRPGAHALPLSTSGLRNLRGLGEPPRPMSLPARSRARLPGSRPASRPRRARPGGRRRQSPQPTAPPPSARLCSPATRPHNGSGRALTYPARPARTSGPGRIPPARKTLSRSPTHCGGRRGGCTALNSHNPSNTLLHLAFSHPSLSLRSPGGDPPSYIQASPAWTRDYRPLEGTAINCLSSADALQRPGFWRWAPLHI